MAQPPRFISFEGGEGAGKSTQLRQLAHHLRAQGLVVEETREPGGTSGAEAIRALLLSGAGDRWGTMAETMLFAAARADHVVRLIRPALARGAWVLCDRYVDSTRAYQGGAGGVDDADIMALHRIGTGGLMPDRTILLRCSPASVVKRLAARDGGASDRIGARPAAYHAQVAAAFDRLAIEEPERFRLVDGDGDVTAVGQRVVTALADLIA